MWMVCEVWRCGVVVDAPRCTPAGHNAGRDPLTMLVSTFASALAVDSDSPAISFVRDSSNEARAASKSPALAWSMPVWDSSACVSSAEAVAWRSSRRRGVWRPMLMIHCDDVQTRTACPLKNRGFIGFFIIQPGS